MIRHEHAILCSPPGLILIILRDGTFSSVCYWAALSARPTSNAVMQLISGSMPAARYYNSKIPHEEQPTPFTECLSAPRDSGLALWLGNFYWMNFLDYIQLQENLVGSLIMFQILIGVYELLGNY